MAGGEPLMIIMCCRSPVSTILVESTDYYEKKKFKKCIHLLELTF